MAKKDRQPPPPEPPRRPANHPEKPEDLEGEALLEWDRICVELDTVGRLDPSARALLIIYVAAWELHHYAMMHVRKHGAVVKHHNGVPGPNPYYKVSRETANQLRAILVEMGLTPATAAKGRKSEPEPMEI